MLIIIVCKLMPCLLWNADEKEDGLNKSQDTFFCFWPTFLSQNRTKWTFHPLKKIPAMRMTANPIPDSWWGRLWSPDGSCKFTVTSWIHSKAESQFPTNSHEFTARSWTCSSRREASSLRHHCELTWLAANSQRGRKHVARLCSYVFTWSVAISGGFFSLLPFRISFLSLFSPPFSSLPPRIFFSVLIPFPPPLALQSKQC